MRCNASTPHSFRSKRKPALLQQDGFSFVWSTKLPDAPGLWWFEIKYTGCPHNTRVETAQIAYDEKDGEFFGWDESGIFQLDEHAAQRWAGPIPEPAEP